MIKQALGDLSRQLDAEEFEIFEFEASLAKFVENYTVQSIRPLLTLFRDDHAHDEAQFSILHAIENFEDSDYCKEIVSGLKDLENASERWLSMILQRLANNPNCYAVFCNYASTATDAETISALKDSVLIMRNQLPDSDWQRISTDLKIDLN